MLKDLVYFPQKEERGGTYLLCFSSAGGITKVDQLFSAVEQKQASGLA